MESCGVGAGFCGQVGHAPLLMCLCLWLPVVSGAVVLQFTVTASLVVSITPQASATWPSASLTVTQFVPSTASTLDTNR